MLSGLDKGSAVNGTWLGLTKDLRIGVMCDILPTIPHTGWSVAENQNEHPLTYPRGTQASFSRPEPPFAGSVTTRLPRPFASDGPAGQRVLELALAVGGVV